MQETKTLNLHQKILKIADAAGVLRKTKEGYGYKYTPEPEIQAKVTSIMQKLGVMLYHAIVPGTLKVTPLSYRKYDNKVKQEVPVNEVVVSADTIYTWVNTDNPTEKLEVPYAMVGQMTDASQAFGAGETYCNRYFLMKSLQLATSEADPDEYRSKQKEVENYEENKELNKLIDDVVKKGNDAIKAGCTKDAIMGVVGKLNNGNKNPSSIKDVETCNKVLEEFEKMIKNNNKKETK